jgi:hypothetical protein
LADVVLADVVLADVVLADVVLADVVLADVVFSDLDDFRFVTAFSEFSLFAELDSTTLLDTIDSPCCVAFRRSSFVELMPRWCV